MDIRAPHLLQLMGKGESYLIPLPLMDQPSFGKGRVLSTCAKRKLGQARLLVTCSHSTCCFPFYRRTQKPGTCANAKLSPVIPLPEFGLQLSAPQPSVKAPWACGGGSPGIPSSPLVAGGGLATLRRELCTALNMHQIRRARDCTCDLDGM